ncbi:hypothetical protein, partial [Paenibacillus periandrae]|uniref:hypothetical protein n=1 Tax=Paenibacillus periandrae TaxID=1761741 RepID=UPI001F08DA3E
MYFLVDANGENSSDGTKWDPVITYGVSNAASQQFSSVQGHNNWYYQEWNGNSYVNMVWDNLNQFWQGSQPW